MSPAVHSHAVRLGEMGDSSSPIAVSAAGVVAMLKSKGILLVLGGRCGCERRGDFGGGVGDVGDVGGESMSSFAIQSVMSTSVSSASSSVVAVPERVERDEVREWRDAEFGEEGEEGLREKSRTGR